MLRSRVPDCSRERGLRRYRLPGHIEAVRWWLMEMVLKGPADSSLREPGECPCCHWHARQRLRENRQTSVLPCLADHGCWPTSAKCLLVPAAILPASDLDTPPGSSGAP